MRHKIVSPLAQLIAVSWVTWKPDELFVFFSCIGLTSHPLLFGRYDNPAEGGFDKRFC